MKNSSLVLALLCIVSYQLKAQTILSGNHKVTGTLQVENSLDVLNTTPNATKTILARLNEGGESHLSVKSYDSQPISSKMFSIEHKFYGQLNNAISFHRGGGTQDGYITVDIYNGTPIAKFSFMGLDVDGIVHAKTVQIDNSSWADFVFEKDYQLPSLNEVNRHILENRHLPGIPSAAEVAENGVNLGEMQVKLLQKIEELTLYVIQQQETIEALKAEMAEMKKN